jgi:acyl-CoA hydrolase/GNAT superfamily N-acetyltransferase
MLHDLDWQQRYAAKLASPRQAISAIRPGRRILVGSGAAEPVRLVQGLVDHGEHLCDNEVVHLLTLGPAPYVRPDLQRKFRHTAFFIGANVREAVQEGRADFIPVFLSEIPDLIRSRRVRVDVALVQVSPPDRHGYVSLGVSVDIVRAAVETAEVVLAEVNPRMPRTLGDSFLHVDRIRHLVPVDAPLLEHAPDPPDAVALEIGQHVARLIPDGATLQMGIGTIPDAVLASLDDRHDLGVHTEMFSDGVKRLAERGVVNGRKKTVLPGKIVTSFIMGSHALYAWAHDNPAVEMRPSEFTNDPATIARNDKMIAINSAIAIDLTGQVAADTVRGRFFSGIGGQVDFIRGSAKSRGGRPIIALPSTAKNGTVSRIQATLDEGAGVVTTRGDVRYVVTEHGAVDLWGKSIRERATALIGIAHPDFRGELAEAAKKKRYIFPDQPVLHAGYPWKEERTERLGDGAEVLVRPIRTTDVEPLQDLFYRLSDESVQARFLGPHAAHPHAEMMKLVDLDYDASMGLVACLPGSDEILAMTRYDVDPATRLADLAVVVRDDWQGRGLGAHLVQRMSEIARARGLAGFRADVLASNKRVLGLFYAAGMRLEGREESGVYHLVARFDAPAPEAGAKAAAPSR